jgi:peptide/nickel transport system ATP-binding protein
MGGGGGTQRARRAITILAMSQAASPTSPATPAQPLLQVKDLRTYFPIRSGVLQLVTGHVKAVNGVTFHVNRGETLGLVGESGCGKTTVGRTLLRLIPATSGTVTFDGADVFSASGSTLRKLRRSMQIIFQDPAGSLNPRMRIRDIIGEPIEVHGLIKDKDQLRARVEELLELCGMPKIAADRYPHEFSGGQRQRIGIARALALNPKFIVCDEPTSALDVSIQSQILNLLADLRDELGLSYLFISHDMAVINHICDRIAVMYKGQIVEEGTRDEVIGNPKHRYTQALLSAVPEADPTQERQRLVFEGMAM